MFSIQLEQSFPRELLSFSLMGIKPFVVKNPEGSTDTGDSLHKRQLIYVPLSAITLLTIETESI